jgi:DNA-directed RNA polymerase subunit F
MDQETRIKVLSKLLENPGSLTEEEKDKLRNQLMHEINNIDDPETRKNLITNMLSNMKDLPPEMMTQLLSNINDLPPGEQKELLKQILEKFDELPPEMKEKLVDDLLKSAAG